MIISRLFFVAILTLVSCDQSNGQQSNGQQLPPGHWVVARDAVEEYRRFVREEDGKILIEIMHAWNSSASPWGVYKNGASLGDYLTEEQAKSAAEKALKK